MRFVVPRLLYFGRQITFLKDNDHGGKRASLDLKKPSRSSEFVSTTGRVTGMGALWPELAEPEQSLWSEQRQ